jgi:hypothetical protein
VSKYIHPITLEAAIEVASNLRTDDYRELVEGHGHQPIETLSQAASWPSTVYFTVPDGRIAGLAGVHSNGAVWMLCTPAIEAFPHTFVKEAKRFINSREEPLLWNIVDKRNKVHLKLLQFLGFKFLREVIHGPNNLTFIEFCRVHSDYSGRR